MHRTPCRHSGRPVQHHRHPSRSFAWFKAAQCAAIELRDKEFAKHLSGVELSKLLSMVLDGARSATRSELVCGTCATRVTRGTFDFQEGDGIELRAGNLQGNFQAQSAKAAFKAS